MKIIEKFEAKDHVYAITESASSGGGWKDPSYVRLIKVDRDVFEAGLEGKRLPNTRGVEILGESFEDRRYTGPNSSYGRTVEEFRGQLAKDAKAQAEIIGFELQSSTVKIPPSFKECVSAAKAETPGAEVAHQRQSRMI